jgi:hypothetical protein
VQEEMQGEIIPEETYTGEGEEIMSHKEEVDMCQI